MAQELWTAVDQYLNRHLLAHDAVLEAVLRANAEAGLPPIDVAPNQGKLLHLLARVAGAKRILEIGTLGGYSTIWLARALHDGGTVITLEASEKHARVARSNFELAGVADRVELRLGPALDSLQELARENAAFDFVFIDADKPNNPHYVDWAVKLGRKGTVIVVDNVVREGEILNEGSADGNIPGTRAMFDQVGNDERLDATAVQTVGLKKHDGFLLAVVK